MTSADPGLGRQQASELIASRFTRVMNASTSPHGQLCDLSMAALFSALPLVLLVRQAAGGDLISPVSALLVAIALVPIIISLIVGWSLRGARDKVIDWMAAQPVPIENLNSLLAGISDEFEIHFDPAVTLPVREDLQKLLDPVSDDTLATVVDEERRYASIKIGVIDSPRFPLQSNHQRYVRFQRIVEQVLLPLHRDLPFSVIRVV
jgi:hypothetical protein